MQIFFLFLPTVHRWLNLHSHAREKILKCKLLQFADKLFHIFHWMFFNKNIFHTLIAELFTAKRFNQISTRYECYRILGRTESNDKRKNFPSFVHVFYIFHSLFLSRALLHLIFYPQMMKCAHKENIRTKDSKLATWPIVQ